jgi:hypothetical protein
MGVPVPWYHVPMSPIYQRVINASKTWARISLQLLVSYSLGMLCKCLEETICCLLGAIRQYIHS